VKSAERTKDFPIVACRKQFPAFQRFVAGWPAAFFDGPGGSQVPQRVIDAVSHCLAHTNANHGGRFATSDESDGMLDAAHQAAADLVGSDDPQTIFFGANMTSLTFAVSRALARDWSAGDEILVTRLDHDANVRPWVLAARDAGATVRMADIRLSDCTLDLEDLRSKLSRRTKLVAVGCASNSVGTINPVSQIARWAHEVGALVYVDAVHWAPHALIDVNELGCDFLACSAYKFFGPHVGMVWGRRELLESLPAYKVRPAPDQPPGRWMTGTQNHEGIAGTLAAIDYLADLGRRCADDVTLARRAALASAFDAIHVYEQKLSRRLLAGLAELPQIEVRGITDLQRLSERVPTVSFVHRRLPAEEVASRLGAQGLFVWHGNYYALELSEALGAEPQGMVRVGLLHYNTAEEVERLLVTLAQL
jgi:cysteine desulfurase family protein (TIGR01976 family)